MGILQILDSIAGGGGTDSGRRGGGTRGRNQKLDPVHEQITDDIRISYVEDTSPRGRAAAANQRRIYGGDGNGFADANRRPIIEVRDPQSGAYTPINPGKAAVSPGEQGVLLEAYLDGKYDPFTEVGITQQSRDVLNASGQQISARRVNGDEFISRPTPQLPDNNRGVTSGTNTRPQARTEAGTTEISNSEGNSGGTDNELLTSLRKRLGSDFAPTLERVLAGVI